jgi:hypothetical protein
MLEQQATVVRQQIEALMREYPDLAEDEILRADMLEGETDLAEIVTAIHRMTEDAKALRDGTQERLDDLTARRNRFKQRVEFGRELILKILNAADIKKLELPEVTVSLRNNKPHLLGDVDPNLLPDELVKITRAIDRAKVREAIEAGQEVEGFVLSNAPPSLLVKVK